MAKKGGLNNSQKLEDSFHKNMNDKFHFEIDDMDMERRIPRHMISPNSIFKLIWNLVILFLVVYTAASLPIRLAFMEEAEIGQAIHLFDIFTDLIFIIDIVLNFFFVEEDVNGEMIMDQRKIAWTYIKTWFFVDIVASIPVSLIVIFTDDSQDGLVSIRFLKLTKLTRLYRLLALFKLVKLFKNHKYLEIAVSYLHISPDAKQIVSSLVRMVFLLHIVGCSFGIVA